MNRIADLIANSRQAPMDKVLVIFSSRMVEGVVVKQMGWVSTAEAVEFFALCNQEAIADSLMEPLASGCMRIVEITDKQ